MYMLTVLLEIIVLSTRHAHYAASLSINPLVNDVTTLQPDGSANDVLHKLLLLNNDDDGSHQLIRLDGFVSKRRSIGKSLVFLDVIPSVLPRITDAAGKTEEFANTKPVQALMRRDIWQKKATNNHTSYDETQYDLYRKIIQPGVYCSLWGKAGPSRLPNEALLFCQSARYNLPNDNPQHLRNVIQFARNGVLDVQELCEALTSCIDREDIMQLLHTKDGENTLTNGECAADILSRFPRNFLLNPSKLMGNSNTAKVSLLPPVPEEYKLLQLVDPSSFHGDSTDPSTIQRILQWSNAEEDSTSIQQFTFSGWVQNRRRFQHTVSVLELVDSFSSTREISERISELDMTSQSSNFSRVWSDRIHVVIDPNFIGTIETAEMYGNILAPGSQIRVRGYVKRSDISGITVCWISSCRLLRSSWKLNAIRQTLELLHSNRIDIDEAADALQLEGGFAQAEQIASGSMTSTDRQWMAAEIAQSLQSEHSRYGTVTPEMTQALEKYADLRHKYPIEMIHVESSCPLFRESRANSTSTNSAASTSRWERAKKPQLVWMIDQISEVLASHPEYGKRVLKILDIGGGKGLLSNLLAQSFGDTVEVQVVDISRSATNNGMMRARRSGIENVKYKSQDASTLDVEGVDCVVALHACGGLSDVALGHAVSQGAGFVICPCNPNLRVPVSSVESARKDLVTVEDWLDVRSATYEQLKQTAELQGDIKLSSKAMHTICVLRALAVERLWKNKKFPISTTIKSFPIGLSTRNLCLVGTFD